MSEVVAILPIKKRSTRCPDKNFRMLGDKPLWQWPFETLLKTPSIDRIVWTVCPDLGDGMKAWFQQMCEVYKNNFNGRIRTQLVFRPQELCEDKATAHDFLSHVNNIMRSNSIEVEAYVFTHPTNPFIRTETINTALDMHRAYHPASVVAVSEVKQKLWKERDEITTVLPIGQPVNHDPLRMVPTQDLEPYYIENCSLYVFSPKTLEREGSHQTEYPVLLKTGLIESWDIDTEEDFLIAEAIAKSGVYEVDRN